MIDKKPPKALSFLFPTFGDILWLSTFYLVLMRGRAMINADGDLALHLNLGKYILQYGEIPLRDVFSHTMTGQPVIQHEWLTTVIFSFAERHFGLTGVIVICALVVATAFWFLFNHMQNKSQTLILSFSVAFLTIIVSMIHWLSRPHLVTFLLLTLWMIKIDQIKSGKVKDWWTLPLIMLAWVNLHGGFIIGFITWLIYGVGLVWDRFWNRMADALPNHFWRYYLLSGVSAFAISLLNPSGIRLWEKVILHVGNQYLADFTREFRSPNFHWTSSWPALFFIALFILTLGYRSKKIESPALFNAVAWLMMGLYSGRNLPLFAIITAPLLVLCLNETINSLASQSRFLSKIISLDSRLQGIEKQLTGVFWPLIGFSLAVIALNIGYHFDFEKKGYAFDPEVFPIQAINWLEENPQEGEMFNLFQWGGYLEYRLWPEEQVFIDSKSDFYGEAFVRQYEQVMKTDEDWQEVLENYSVDWAILPPDSYAVREMQRELGWEVVYQDGTTVILRDD